MNFLEELYENIERTKTGVNGLDTILYGGIPKGNLVVLSGDPGSGKTITSIEFLYRGAMKFNEPGVFISLELEEKDIIKTAAGFGWDLQALIDKNMLVIETIQLYNFDRLCDTIEALVEKIKAKRVVIDPGVIIRLYFEKELEARKKVLELRRVVRKLGCTTIITNERTMDRTFTLFGLEEYVSDGVILLYHSKLESRFIRSCAVLKMRYTKTSESLHPLKIEKKGVNILAEQEQLEDVE
ncbi:MAG: hypothetical protein COT15_01950 [Candidatus Diapherotrites archaeon CG08_land_8_20_14_0_20_34_12]|nr:MAG: hypothetical protein COT15_01950 [Candidatus Diapherotrites archaeon CG08_land_8_20_14_0_20_34_12]